MPSPGANGDGDDIAGLRERNVRRDLAAQTAGNCHGPWRLSKSPAFPTAFFTSLGLPKLAPSSRLTNRTAVYGLVRLVV